MMLMGNNYIDHCLAYGPLILGHADKTVVSDLTNQLTMGTAYGAPTENEIKLSREVINRIPSAEMVSSQIVEQKLLWCYKSCQRFY